MGSRHDELTFGSLEEATFERRPNRYLAWVNLDGKPTAVHVPDPGRMLELLVPGRRVYVRRVERPTRRATAYDLVLVDYESVLVSINTQVPNRLIRRALEKHRLPAFAEYETVRAEVKLGASRFDFMLSTGDDVPGRTCFVEVKSVGLMRDGIAWFPDAVTLRGRRHVEELARIRAGEVRTAVIFVCQRNDVSAVSADAEVDPGFAAAITRAIAAGVEVFAWRCAVGLRGIRLEKEIPFLRPTVLHG